MRASDLIGFAIVALVAAPSAFVLVRFPDFRREFVAYWHPDAVARRLEAFAERLDRRT